MLMNLESMPGNKQWCSPYMVNEDGISAPGGYSQGVMYITFECCHTTFQLLLALLVNTQECTSIRRRLLSRRPYVQP